MVMHGVSVIMQILSFIMSLVTVCSLVIKPIRDKLFKTREIEDGQKCILRAEMLSIYYEAKDNDGRIRQYKFENFVLMYAAYKALGGNSFIEKIKTEVEKMEVVT